MVSNKFVYSICLVLIIMLVGGVSAAELSAKSVEEIDKMSLTNQIDLKENVLTESTNSKVLVNSNGVEITNKYDNANIKSEMYVDGSKYTYTSTIDSDKSLTLKSESTLSKGVTKLPIEVSYEINPSKFKEKIVLQEDRELSFNIIVPNGFELIPWFNNQWKIVKSNSGDTMTGTVIEEPFGIDADGDRITMNYTYVNGKLKLNYDRYKINYIDSGKVGDNNMIIYTPTTASISYPLTIDPTWVSFNSHWIDSTSIPYYNIEMWNASGTSYWLGNATTVEYLVIGGGGGGNGDIGGGGGAGQFLNGSAGISIGSNYTMVVGSGGTGGSGSRPSTGGSNGGYSNFSSSISATGGGLGGSYGVTNGEYGYGFSGASGGGGSGARFTIGGYGLVYNGHDGGGDTTSTAYGAGGGGSGTAGGNSNTGGYGGIGLSTSITGENRYYAGGGGGSNYPTALGNGGLGGGGSGGGNTDNAVAGEDGTGSGGGGGATNGASTPYQGKKGGTGLIVLKYISPTLINTFTASPTSALTKQSINFNDTSLGGIPTSWQWTFNDGSTSTSKNVTKSYSNSGVYNINLTRANHMGSNSTSRANYITITDPTPYSQFTANTTSGTTFAAIAFTDNTNTTNANITSWNWSFGGANFSTLQNPIFNFTSIGLYTVTLNTTTPTTYNKTTRSNYINITSGPANPYSYVSLTPTSKPIPIPSSDIITLNAKNITAKSIYVNLSFNKTSLKAMSATYNFSVLTGLHVDATYNNISGFMTANISNVDSSDLVIGNTLTPLMDISFKTIGYTNTTVPINYNSASILLMTDFTENIITKTPGSILTTYPLFTYNINILDVATNSKILTLLTVNATSSNITPTYQQTENGVTTFTSNYGNVNFTVTAQGYYDYAQTKLITSSDDLTFKLTPFSGSQQATWYSPHQVRLTTIDDFNGAKLFGATIDITPLTNTFPTGANSDWLVNVYGINSASANDMMNGTLIMNGSTDSDGSVVFTMLSSIGYNVHITNVTAGIDHTVKIYPLESDYNIWISTSSAATPLYNNLESTELTYESPNATYGKFGLTYKDLSGLTTSVKFNVTNAVNRTVMYSTTISGFGTETVYANYTIKAVKGEQYRWSYNATRV